MTAEQIAGELEISVRTVYRYIDALCMSGVPIVAESGHGGGFGLTESFRRMPLFFDQQEQTALTHAVRFAERSGYPYGEALCSAMSKIRFALTAEQLALLERHSRAFDVVDPFTDQETGEQLALIEQAVADSEQLSLVYENRHGAVTGERLIDPYGFVFYSHLWYLVGYCHLRREIRRFRVDRIRRAERTGGRFSPPVAFDIHAYLMNVFHLEQREDEVEVTMVLTGTPDAIRRICRHWYLKSRVVEQTGEQAVIRIGMDTMLTYMPHFLLSLGTSVRVIEPPELRARLASDLAELMAHHADNSS